LDSYHGTLTRRRTSSFLPSAFWFVPSKPR